MNALIKQKNALLERRRKEMQNQINVYKKQANKIVRNGATREANQRNRIKALENNRNRWQAEFNLAKQRLNVKNANLLKKIEQIKKTQSKVARLQKELTNTKTASAAEKNAIKTQLEKEKQNLALQITQTQTDLKSTEAELKKITQNRNILFKELQNRSGTLSQTRSERNKLQKQLEDTKKILGNTQNNLGQLALVEQRARGQRNTLSSKLAQVRGQRQNLRRRNGASQKVITGLTRQRQNAQSQLARSRWQGLAGKQQVSSLRSQRNLTTSKLTVENLRKKLYQRVNRLPLFNLSKGGLRNRVMKAQSMGEMRSIQQELNSKQPQKTGDRGQGFAASGRTAGQNWRYE